MLVTASNVPPMAATIAQIFKLLASSLIVFNGGSPIIKALIPPIIAPPMMTPKAIKKSTTSVAAKLQSINIHSQHEVSIKALRQDRYKKCLVVKSCSR